MDWCTVNPGFDDSVKQGCGQTKVRTAMRREVRTVQPEHQPCLFKLTSVPRYSKPSLFTIATTPHHHTTLFVTPICINTKIVFLYCHQAIYAV